MNVITQYMTNNDCYKRARKNQLKGIMVHSTGCAFVPASGWYARWNKPGVEKCVHAFVDDKEVRVYLPYEMGAWHSGTGGAKPANIDHIAFEMCEPGPGASSSSYNPAQYEAYTRACISNAVDYCVMLCRKYGFTAADITSHYEGYKQGIASNHSDPKHWFDKHSYSMDQFRRDVDRKLKGVIEIMGGYIYVDGLIDYIKNNSVSIVEQATTTKHRTTANLYYHTAYPGNSGTRAGKWPKGTIVDVLDGWEAQSDGYTWVKVLYEGGTYYAAREYLERV